MHKHTAEETALGRADFPSEIAWAEWVRDYYRNIETYDWVDVADNYKGLESFFHRNRRTAVRRLVSRFGAGTPMLDAGCGTGLNLAGLPRGSVGIDLNPRNLELVRRRLPEHPVVLGDIEGLPFDDGTFGTVICTEVLEHVPYPEKALSEIFRVLRPGGVLIGSVPSRSLVWKLRFLSSTCPGDEPFHNEYNPAQVRTMLGQFETPRIWLSLLHFNVMFVARRPG